MSAETPAAAAASYARFSRFLQRARFSPEAFHLRIAHPSTSPSPTPATPSSSLPSAEDASTAPAERGICAATDLVLPRGTPLLSIPWELLITPERMLSSASVLALLPRSSLSQLSSEQLLVLFLVLHRRLGEASPACPYLELLPSSYSSLEWWSEAELQLLCARQPAEGDSDAISEPWSDEDDPILYHREQCAHIRRECAQLNALLVARHPQLPSCRYEEHAASASTTGLPLTLSHPTAPPADHPLCNSADAPLPCFRCQVSVAEYQWAHSTVASRSCYWPPSPQLAVTSPSPTLSCCLVPFLDLLNHSSFVTAACAFDAATRRYQLAVRDRHPMRGGEEEEELRVKAGEEVFISYGELSNWQLLTRYGFVLADSQDERVDLPVDRIEAFIARHCGEKRRRGPRQSPVSQANGQSADAVLTADASPANGSSPASIRCCCTRTLLPQALTAEPPPSSLPALPTLPAMSGKHSALLGLLGLYELPHSFPLSCCQPQWHLLTFIKVRTAFASTQGDGVNQVQMQRLAALMSREDDAQELESRGWIDAEHERRGRGLLIALASWVEGRGGGEKRSLEAEMAEREWLQQHRVQVEAESSETGVSWLSRVLSVQFRISRRRMLLGFIHQQQMALQTLDQ